MFLARRIGPKTEMNSEATLPPLKPPMAQIFKLDGYAEPLLEMALIYPEMANQNGASDRHPGVTAEAATEVTIKNINLLGRNRKWIKHF